MAYRIIDTITRAGKQRRRYKSTGHNGSIEQARDKALYKLSARRNAGMRGKSFLINQWKTRL